MPSRRGPSRFYKLATVSLRILPPETPQFQYVQSTAFRQIFKTPTGADLKSLRPNSPRAEGRFYRPISACSVRHHTRADDPGELELIEFEAGKRHIKSKSGKGSIFPKGA